jgi:hypothetical protein
VRLRAARIGNDAFTGPVRVPRFHRRALVRHAEVGEHRIAEIDVGEIALDDLGLESKSLKLYLMTFRDEGHFCEALAVRIRDDVAQALEVPAERVAVTLVQKARGGITITATT